MNTTSDSLFPGAGLLSLPEAIAFANVDPSGNSNITFDNARVQATPQTITLTGTQLELSNTSETETITGPKAGVTVSGGGLSRVFQVDAAGHRVHLGTDDHRRQRPADNGGGLCQLRHDHADQLHRQRQLRYQLRGGGVYNRRHAHADQLHRQRQLRRDGGGGVFDHANSGTATLTNCTVSGNSAYRRHGGGVYNNGTVHPDQLHRQRQLRRRRRRSVPGGPTTATLISGTTTLTNCTVSGNSAPAAAAAWKT